MIYYYKHYFRDFYDALSPDAQRAVDRRLEMLKLRPQFSANEVKKIAPELFELRVAFMRNAYRIFFTFDEGNIVILFNAFHKKTQKTPKKEIELAKRLIKEYHEQI